jgi:uncharacterized membrane protein YqjE
MTAMNATPTSPPDSGASSPRRLAAAVLGLLQGHLSLIGEEVREQKQHVVGLLVLALGAAVFALMLLFGLSALVMISFWDTHRLAAAIGVCVFHGLAGAVCVALLLSRVRSAATPFRASLDELARDRERLLP